MTVCVNGARTRLYDTAVKEIPLSLQVSRAELGVNAEDRSLEFTRNWVPGPRSCLRGVSMGCRTPEQPSTSDQYRLHDAGKTLCNTTTKLFFHKGVSIVSLDDDQLQLRSTLLALVGITRKHNPQKRYGPVCDMACSFSTGLVLVFNLVAGAKLLKIPSSRAWTCLLPVTIMLCVTQLHLIEAAGLSPTSLLRPAMA